MNVDLATYKNKDHLLEDTQSYTAKKLSAFMVIESSLLSPHKVPVVFVKSHFHITVPCKGVWSGFASRTSPSTFLLPYFFLFLLCVTLTPLPRQRNCYGFGESCSLCVQALHVATLNTVTWNVEMDVPSEFLTVADFCRHNCIKQEVLWPPEYNQLRRERILQRWSMCWEVLAMWVVSVRCQLRMKYNDEK
jgi:hypothetical protein